MEAKKTGSCNWVDDLGNLWSAETYEDGDGVTYTKNVLLEQAPVESVDQYSN